MISITLDQPIFYHKVEFILKSDSFAFSKSNLEFDKHNLRMNHSFDFSTLHVHS